MRSALLLAFVAVALLVSRSNWRVDSGRNRVSKLLNLFFCMFILGHWVGPFNPDFFYTSFGVGCAVPLDAPSWRAGLLGTAGLLMTLVFACVPELAARRITAWRRMKFLVPCLLAVDVVGMAAWPRHHGLAKMLCGNAEVNPVAPLMLLVAWAGICVAMCCFYWSGRTRAVFVSATKLAMAEWLAGKAHPCEEHILRAGTVKYAAREIGRLGPDGADLAPELSKHLAHESTRARIAAARALGRVGCDADEVVEGLEKATQDPDDSVRQAATEALQKIKAPSTGSPRHGSGQAGQDAQEKK